MFKLSDNSSLIAPLSMTPSLSSFQFPVAGWVSVEPNTNDTRRFEKQVAGMEDVMIMMFGFGSPSAYDYIGDEPGSSTIVEQMLDSRSRTFVEQIAKNRLENAVLRSEGGQQLEAYVGEVENRNKNGQVFRTRVLARFTQPGGVMFLYSDLVEAWDESVWGALCQNIVIPGSYQLSAGGQNDAAQQPLAATQNTTIATTPGIQPQFGPPASFAQSPVLPRQSPIQPVAPQTAPLPVSAVPAAPNQVMSSQLPNRSNKNLMIGLVIAAIVIVVFLIFAAVFFMNNGRSSGSTAEGQKIIDNATKDAKSSKVGEAMQLGDVTATVVGIDQNVSGYNQSESSYKYVRITLKFENKTNKSVKPSLMISAKADGEDLLQESSTDPSNLSDLSFAGNLEVNANASVTKTVTYSYNPTAKKVELILMAGNNGKIITHTVSLL